MEKNLKLNFVHVIISIKSLNYLNLNSPNGLFLKKCETKTRLQQPVEMHTG